MLAARSRAAIDVRPNVIGTLGEASLERAFVHFEEMERFEVNFNVNTINTSVKQYFIDLHVFCS